MVKNILTSTITAVIVAVVVVGLALSGGAKPVAPSNEGTNLAGISTVREIFGQGFEAQPSVIQGNLTHRNLVVSNSLVSTSSSLTSYTAIPRDFVGYSTVVINPIVGSLNVTLPASTTFPSTFLPRIGDRTDFILFNASTTAGINIGILAGTGSLVEVASSTSAAVTASTSPAKATRVEIIRKWNTDLVFLVSPFF